MKLLSVNVSLPKEVPYMDKTATTGIFKEPVKRPDHAPDVEPGGGRSCGWSATRKCSPISVDATILALYVVADDEETWIARENGAVLATEADSMRSAKQATHSEKEEP